MTETTGKVVGQREAVKVIAALREAGFIPGEDPLPPVGNSRTRVYTNDLGDEVIIGPLLPTASGRRIIITTKGASPLIEDAVEQIGDG